MITNKLSKWDQPAFVGVDIGLKNIAVLSDGRVFQNDHTYRKALFEFKQAGSRLSKSLPQTKQYKRNICRLNHKYMSVVNRRKEMVEKVSLDIARKYTTIVMEDLSIKELKTKSLSTSMNISYIDGSLGKLRQRIFCKAMEAGRKIVLVNPRNTSQMCSGCGHIVHKELSDRVHSCPFCNLTIDRDLNASINILRLGLTSNPSLALEEEKPRSTTEAQRIDGSYEEWVIARSRPSSKCRPLKKRSVI